MSRHSPRSGDDDAASVVYQTDLDEKERVTTNILLALDSLPEFDAENSEELLFEHVDPDALNALFQSATDANRTRGSVTFPIRDYEVRVSARGEVVVRDPSN